MSAVGVSPAPPRGWAAPLCGARFTLLLGVLGVVLVAAIVLAVGVGTITIAPSVSARIVAHHLLPGTFAPAGSAVQDQIIWSFRMPRVLLAAVVGAGLAVVGAVLQTLVRNPLADPYLLGVSAGAALGAVVVFVLGSAAAGGLGPSSAAFAGALLSTALVYSLAQRSGRITPERLVLAGVALAYLFQAGYSYLLLKTETLDDSRAVLFWLLGSLGGARWSTLALPTGGLAIGVVALLLQTRPLNALLAGEETAISLGVSVRRFQIQMLVVTSLVTGLMVAVSGAIAFVGLIVPHVARIVVGADHRRLLPVAALVGAGFLIAVDVAARTLDRPAELPLSIVTAVFGAPFFLWLLRRRHRSGNEELG